MTGTGIDPVKDIDVLYAFGPRFHETSRVSVIVGHNKPDEAMALVLQGLNKHFKGEWIGDEARGVIDFRKHVAWYTKGFTVGSQMRQRLAMASSLAELDEHLAALDLDQPWPEGADGPRGRTAGAKRVILPEGWLDDPYDQAVACAGAELDTSGG